MSGVVIAGAGIAGIRAAEAMRASGVTDSITIISPETPAYRPAVSKDALKGEGEQPFPYRRDDADLIWLHGAQAIAIAPEHDAVQVELADGTRRELACSGLVIASGLRSRHLRLPGPTGGRFTLRTLADAQALRPHLRTGARICIIGSGFIGCEVAATARQLGCEVTIVALERVPLEIAVGPEVGGIIAARHERAGVVLRTQRAVQELQGSERVTSVVLDDGSVIEVDVVVEAVGSIPCTPWLEDSGLDVADGVLTDAHLRAVGARAPIVACGDVARHPHAAFGDQARRIEHWTAAGDLGTYAGRELARQLAGDEAEPPAYAAIPAFWSDQYDLQLQSFGIPSLGQTTVVVERDGDACIIEFHDARGIVGVVGINRTAELGRYRKAIAARVTS